MPVGGRLPIGVEANERLKELVAQRGTAFRFGAGTSSPG